MKRRLYQDLMDWKQRGARKPLMVLGARQVGKTYIIKQFCEQEFSHRHIFTLTDRPDIVSLFAEPIPTQDKIDRLQILIGQVIEPASTVLFFDEAQVSEDLIASLKFFAESDLPYHIICAGSLLGVRLARFSASFPVGQVEILRLGPMDFAEYLDAAGSAALWDEIQTCAAQHRPMAQALHEKALGLYRRYLWAGGMPAAVSNLLEHDNDPLQFDRRILANIHESYLADMAHYIQTPLESARIEAVYRSLPAQLGNPSRKFQYAMASPGARAREWASALDWLVASEMVRRTDMVARPETPLGAYQREGYFKLFLNDTGLLSQAVGLIPRRVLLDEDFAFKGVLAENYVAVQLAARGVPLFYWRNDNQAEVDFLIDTDDGVVPVEVKAGVRVTSPSLEAYRERFHPPQVVRVSGRNFGLENGIVSLPLYAAGCLGMSV